MEENVGCGLVVDLVYNFESVLQVVFLFLTSSAWWWPRYPS